MNQAQAVGLRFQMGQEGWPGEALGDWSNPEGFIKEKGVWAKARGNLP